MRKREKEEVRKIRQKKREKGEKERKREKRREKGKKGEKRREKREKNDKMINRACNNINKNILIFCRIAVLYQIQKFIPPESPTDPHN